MAPKARGKAKKQSNKDTAERFDEADTHVVACGADDEGDDESAGTTGQTSKMSNTFNPSDEQVLVDFFRDHPELYDHSDDLYHNRTHKEKFLGRIGKELNTTSKYNQIFTCHYF